ncbi:hypothetical protein ACHAC9_13175 [Massilia sp. CMS3.1]|uniref:hypothetical protein n=1 Tax=Massilia sp. CMS3.1 TaxID=3373083 RepID=UPI003EE6C10F
MDTTIPGKQREPSPVAKVHGQADDTIEIRLWVEEHEWLYGVHTSAKNTSPTFRCPDLISACVEIVLAETGAAETIFTYLGTELVLRQIHTPRRAGSLWKAQRDLLQDLQRSPLNRHPNPKFQLDELTTTCVALCRRSDPSGELVLQQCRINLADRLARSKGIHRSN